MGTNSLSFAAHPWAREYLLRSSGGIRNRSACSPQNRSVSLLAVPEEAVERCSRMVLERSGLSPVAHSTTCSGAEAVTTSSNHSNSKLPSSRDNGDDAVNKTVARMKETAAAASLLPTSATSFFNAPITFAGVQFEMCLRGVAAADGARGGEEESSAAILHRVIRVLGDVTWQQSFRQALWGSTREYHRSLVREVDGYCSTLAERCGTAAKQGPAAAVRANHGEEPSNSIVLPHGVDVSAIHNLLIRWCSLPEEIITIDNTQSSSDPTSDETVSNGWSRITILPPASLVHFHFPIDPHATMIPTLGAEEEPGEAERPASPRYGGGLLSGALASFSIRIAMWRVVTSYLLQLELLLRRVRRVAPRTLGQCPRDEVAFLEVGRDVCDFIMKHGEIQRNVAVEAHRQRFSKLQRLVPTPSASQQPDHFIPLTVEDVYRQLVAAAARGPPTS